MLVPICVPQPPEASTPLPRSEWAVVLGYTWDGIRTDVRREQDAGALVRDVVEVGSDAILVTPTQDIDAALAVAEAVAVSAKLSGRPHTITLEVGNEPDLSGRWAGDPEGFGRLVAACAEMARGYLPELQVISGGVSNVSQRALAWLTRAARQMPHEVVVGYHAYRNTAPNVPLKGYASREDEFKALRAAAGDRMLACTETGWHTAPRPKGFPLCWLSESWSEAEVAAHLRTEVRLHAERALATHCCVYQLRSGPDRRNDQDSFGILRADGTPRAAARVGQEWRA